MHRKAFIAALIIVLFAGSLFAATYEYIVQANKRSEKSTWTVNASGGRILMSNSCGNVKQSIVCSFSGETVEWRFYDRLHQHDFRAVKENGKIIIKGTFSGAKISKIIDAGFSPWYQEPGLQAFKFAKDLAAAGFVDYHMILPATLELASYSLKKTGEEPLVLGGKKTAMIKMENSYSGLMSAIKVGDYWFKKTDGLFAAYRGPGIDPLEREAVVRLLKETN